MARPTKKEIPAVGKTQEELVTHLRQLENQLRGFGLGVQADILENIADNLEAKASQGKSEPPKFAGVLAEITVSNTVTRDLALWMGARLMEAAEVISELMEDAEITGSYPALEKAKDWLRTLGFRD